MRSAALIRSTALAIAVIAAPAARAADIHVDTASGDDTRNGATWAASVATIGRALTLARQSPGGDTVHVAAGTYAENVALSLPDVRLLGGYPPGGGTRNAAVNTTTVDGQGTGPALLVSAAGGNTVLTGIGVDGFTFTNGSQLGRSGILGGGGGVFIEESEIALTNNVISSNVIDGEGLIGAGVYLFREMAGGSVISGNRIEGNVARDGSGGGLALLDLGAAAAQGAIVITGNEVRDNEALALVVPLEPSALVAQGGGLLLWDGEPQVTNNLIEDNTAWAQANVTYAGQGGGVLLLESAPVLTGNTISGNVARAAGGQFGAAGGGVYGWWSDGGAATIAGNTITGNEALGGTGQDQASGGGVAVSVLGDGSPVLRDNTISGNLATGGATGAIGGGVFAYASDDAGSRVRIEGGTVEDNHASSGGGGLWLQDGPAGTMEADGILVRRNAADYGSGVMVFGDADVRNLRIRANYLHDPDGDQVSEIADNCPGLPNSVQSDADADGLGDACDSDDDQDAVQDSSDNCPLVANPGQGASCTGDRDGDGDLDGADNCPDVANADQDDATADGVGDACEPARFDALETNASGMWVFGDPTLTNLEIVRNVGQGLLVIGELGTTDTHSSPNITNVTIAENLAAGLITFLADGTRFRDSIIARNVLSDGFDTERPGGGPSSPNVRCDGVYFWDGLGSLPCAGTGNLDFTDGDAFFVTGGQGDHYLAQAAAGDPQTFVGVDSGRVLASSSPVVGMTTRRDDVADSGTVDMGFHYSRAAAPPPLDPLAGAVRVTRSGGEPRLALTGFSPAITSVRWYRGELDLLVQEYSHRSPFRGQAGDTECAWPPGAALADPLARNDGRDWYYLAVELGAGGEGTFGSDSLGAARPRPEDSPTDLVISACP